jgi:hypothetical protein
MQWQPKWEKVKLEVHGVRIVVERDRVTGLFRCPICGGDKPAYFFTAEDLIQHLLGHARGVESRKVYEAAEEEEEEEYEDQD